MSGFRIHSLWITTALTQEGYMYTYQDPLTLHVLTRNQHRDLAMAIASCRKPR